MRRIAVIMAGGSGERFWPLSRRLRPKQLLKLASQDETLIEQTVGRVAPLVGQDNIYIAAAPHLVAPMTSALAGTVPAQRIWAEPHKRNTAGCLIWVAANLIAQDPASVDTVSMGVIAADHRITPPEGFQKTMRAALEVAEKTGGLVTMGVRPDRPETGYGYIEVGSSETYEVEGVKVSRVKSFREKPDLSTAQSYVASGNYLWNSGSFFWTLKAFLFELHNVAPELHTAIFEIADALRSKHQSVADQRFAALPNISIDYALMEKAHGVYVAEAAFDWDDVGAWDALDRSLPPDSSGNVTQGEVVAVEAGGNIIVNAAPGVVTTVLGVEGLAVVVTEDAVLVIPKDRAQEVKKIVEELKARGIERA